MPALDSSRFCVVRALLTVSFSFVLTAINGAAGATETPKAGVPIASEVFVQVVNGQGKDDQTDERPAPAWISREVKGLGASRASVHTPWIGLSDKNTVIYSSMRGGRLINGVVKPGKQGTVDVEIDGYKIGENKYVVTLENQVGARRVIKLTQYPGERNVYLAVHVGPPAQEPEKAERSDAADSR